MKRHVSVRQTDRNTWKTLSTVSFHGWEVPEGYETDFASVPRFLWSLVPRFGSYTAATVVHDYLLTDELPAGNVTSRQVDRVFRRALKSAGVGAAKQWLMWAGVRWGAVVNPDRRQGVVRDLPAMIGISVLALPLVVPFVVVVPPLSVMWLIDAATGGKHT